MATRVTQLSYNAGELGELLTGRVDDSKYSAGLALCQNAYPTPQGPVRNRAGFMYVNAVKDSSKAVRLIPFVYSADQQIIVELGEYYARFHLRGQTLMQADGSAPYEIATPWRASDLFQIHYTQNADIMTLVHPAYPPQELRRYSMNDWRMVQVSLLTSLLPPSGVAAVRFSSAASDANSEKYTQRYVVTALSEDRTEESIASAEVSVVANLYATGTTVKVSWNLVTGARYYRVYKYQGGLFGYIGETVENSIVDDNIAPETGTTPPYTDDVFQVSGGISGASIVNGGSGYDNGKRVVKVLDYGWWGNGNWNTQEGYAGLMTLPWIAGGVESGFNSGATWRTGTFYNLGIQDLEGGGTGATGEFDTQQWGRFGKQINGGRLTNDGGYGYKRPVLKFEFRTGVKDYICTVGYLECLAEEVPVELEVYDDGGSGYGARLGFVITDGVFTDVYVISPGRNYTNPKVRITTINGSGAEFRLTIGNAGDYPAAVGYFEQRRIFAGSNLRPQQIWMTATGTESNMTYHLPLQDTDRVSFAVAARDLNQIQHIVALQQLIALTSAAEWRVSPLNSDAITPSSISVRPQSYIGASTVQPQIINTNLLYAAARGGHVRELSYDYTAGGYITGDISIRAPHLFTEDNVVVDMALTKSPDPVLWCVRQDGVLLGLSYVPEQKIAAWFEYKTDGAFESAAVVQEGLNDYLYAVVRRTVNGQTRRFVERQMVRTDDYRGATCFLDCAGRLTSSAKSMDVSGLSWLEGRVVTAVGDGIVFSGLTVKDGKVTLPQECADVWVGLPYVTELKTLPVALPSQDGSYARGRVKNVSRVSLRLSKTSGVDAGPDTGHMKPVKARSMESYGKPPELMSGETDLVPTGTWSADGSFVIRQAEPLPFTLICHSAEVVIGDDK